MFVVIETKKKNIHSRPKGRAKKERIICKKSACGVIEYLHLFGNFRKIIFSTGQRSMAEVEPPPHPPHALCGLDAGIHSVQSSALIP